MSVRLIRIRTVMSGPLLPQTLDDSGTVTDLDTLVYRQPGLMGRSAVRDGQSYLNVFLVDGIENAKALHRLLTDDGNETVRRYEAAVAAKAGQSGTVYTTSWKLTP